jgi:mono/diheme cytochrome c family protein
MKIQIAGLVVVACAVALATPVAVGHRTAAHASPPTGNIANGFRVFNDYFCADCHVLKAAGGPASYGVGPNFNKTHVPYQAAVAVVASGLPAALPLYPTQMPPFRNVLTKGQIRDVAVFLAKYSGGTKSCTECKGIVPTGFPTR